MANRSESRSARISELRRPTEPLPAVPPASVPDALEKLATATQGMIAKRIDLLQLDTHELISSLVAKVALVGFGLVLVVAAWLSGISALVHWLMPNAAEVQRHGVFALIHAVIGGLAIVFALRDRLPKLGGESEAELDAAKRLEEAAPTDDRN